MWQVFKVFAQITVVADPPASIDSVDGELFLFEWNLAEAGEPEGSRLSLVRQFALLDEDGDYDR